MDILAFHILAFNRTESQFSGSAERFDIFTLESWLCCAGPIHLLILIHRRVPWPNSCGKSAGLYRVKGVTNTQVHYIFTVITTMRIAAQYIIINVISLRKCFRGHVLNELPYLSTHLGRDLLLTVRQKCVGKCVV